MYKKFSAIAIVLFMVFATTSFAQNTNDIGSSYKTINKEGVKNNYDLIADLRAKYKDDSHVTLKGNITEKLKKKEYLFKDSSGTIVIKVKKDMAETIDKLDNNTLVEIQGKYDKGDKDEIKVKKLIILNK